MSEQLRQTLSSRTLNGQPDSRQPMVTSAQVMQFLGTVSSQGGSNSGMAQNVIQLMEHKPELNAPIAQQLADVAQMSAPRESQVTRALDGVCVRYQEQIAALPRDGASRQQAGDNLSRVLTRLPTMQNGEGQQLCQAIRHGRISADAFTRLGVLIGDSLKDTDVAALKQSLGQLAKSAPESREKVQLLLSALEEKTDKTDLKGTESKHTAMVSEETTQTSRGEPGVFAPVQSRQDQGNGSGQQNTPEKEEEDVLNVRETRRNIGSLVLNDTQRAWNKDVAQAERLVDDSALYSRALSCVVPPAAATVSESSAQRAAQNVMQNPSISIGALTSGSLDSILLQAATLGIDTFSNSAASISKRIKINTDTQATLIDQKVADYQEELRKSQEQAEKSKKANFWSKVFSPITTLFNFIIKPVINLLEKIPGVSELFDFIKKNLSEIALPLAIISSLLCPMSLPMTIGLLTVTSVTAGFSVAEKVMGDKAPEWLKITDQIGDMIAGLAMMAGTMSMMSGMLGNIGSGVSKLFGADMKTALQGMMRWTQRIDAVTSTANGITQGALGIKQGFLQGELGDIEAKLSWNEIQTEWLQSAQKDVASRMESVVSNSGSVLQSATNSINQMGSLRARIASSLV